MMTVACVLKSGGDFTTEYVERLRDGIARNLDRPYRFVCFSDVDVPCERIPLEHNWRGWWSKMELFRPDLDDGVLLYFDLDTVIVGNLSDIAKIDKMTMLGQPGFPPMSGMMVLPREERGRIWRYWIRHPNNWIFMKQGPNDGDQSVIGEAVRGGVSFFSTLVPNQVVSYNLEVRQHNKTVSVVNGVPWHHTAWDGTTEEIPQGARVVYFCNNPRPNSVNWLEHLL